jgi:hypothetical protein
MSTILFALAAYSSLVTFVLARTFAQPIVACVCFVVGCAHSVACAPFRRDDKQTPLVPVEDVRF